MDTSSDTMYPNRIGWERMFVMMPYSDFWKAHRRLFYREFEGAAVKTHRPQQLRGVHDLLRNILSTPDDWNEHLRQ